jgi:pimeloyl-ACP methyl ester carboxylesterase
VKKIALVAPAGALAGQLETCLSEVHQARVFRYEAAPRGSGLSESGFDELWYIRHTSGSLEENQKSMAGLLACLKTHKIPVVNYLSSVFSAGTHDLLPPYRATERCHRYNEAVLQSSGSHVRIFRLPVLLDEPSDAWLQFFRALLRFRDEIEDRMPGYFKSSPLRVEPSRGIAPLLSTTEAAEAMVEISNHAATGNECFYVLDPRSVSLESCFPAIEQATGVVLVSADKQDLNTIDRLFGRRIDEFLPYLQSDGAFSCQQALKRSPRLCEIAAREIDLPGMVLDVIATLKVEDDRKNECRDRAGSLLARRQLRLPDGVLLNYYVGGKGLAPLLILNAFGQGLEYWNRFLEEVFEDYRLVLWLPRGNDFESIGLQMSSPLALHAEDLRAILDRENIPCSHLLAWCTGPKLAVEYYLKYPKAVDSMVFVAGSFKGLAEHRPLETVYEKGLESLLGMVQQEPKMAGLMTEALKNVLLAQDQLGKEAASSPEARFENLLSSVNSSLKKMVLAPFHSSQTVLAYAAQLRDFWDADFTSSLRRVHSPVLFVGGDCDRIAAQEISRRIAQSMPCARYAEVMGGSHYIQYSYPDLLSDIMKSFIENGLQFSFHHPWVSTSEVKTQDSVWRMRNDRKDNDREENQGNVSGNEAAPMPSHGAGIC